MSIKGSKSFSAEILQLAILYPALMGCRKIRWALSGMGKSGEIRVIYYYLTREGEIYLLIAYPKSEKDNLTNSEKNQLRKVIEAIEEAK
ncbi:type II toxin-antitoxin system RelE/ParE family toxin [Yersinia rohdei]|uniref:type II toxin-antitoxin system RelE/ParE family toxin n=1 Tax=Yersinia rohdei TaxID=29485 RepID=UPI0025AAB013|nr:type II toxin-antitoxin system RelE/ParE family toxin [Yersinia rohdei]MDN0093877.1 type II toxin-antitoxin system RelE/ParE family toxin [Yersinia rohdei]